MTVPLSRTVTSGSSFTNRKIRVVEIRVILARKRAVNVFAVRNATPESGRVRTRLASADVFVFFAVINGTAPYRGDEIVTVAVLLRIRAIVIAIHFDGGAVRVSPR